MPSLLVRLRQRAISQSTTTSRTSAGSSTQVDPTASSSELPSIQEQSYSPAISPTIARRIVPDISGLLERYSSDAESSTGLRPPRPRKRSTVESGQDTQEIGDDGKKLVQEARMRGLDPHGGGLDAGPSRQSVPQDQRDHVPTRSRSRLARFAPQLPSGAWSTFGRNKEQDPHKAPHYSPPPTASTSRKPSVESTGPRRQTSTKARRSSKFSSISSFQRYANRSFTSVRSKAATVSRSSSAKYSNEDEDPANHPPSPPLTTSSRQNSTKKSSITHSSHSLHNRPAIPSSPDNRYSGVDSPRTFGAPTPPTQSTGFGPAPPLPPLPPLSNPDIISALSNRALSRSFTLTHVAPNFTTTTPRKWNPAIHGKTYPPRRRRSKVVQAVPHDENTVPFPVELPTRRILRGYSSLPRVRELFALPSNSRDEAPFRSSPLRPRTASSAGSSRRRTKTATSSRRSSAEWSSQQAGVGVTSPVPNQFGWPAEVTQEILRLALGRVPESVSGGPGGDVAGVAEGVVMPRGTHALSALTRETSKPSFPFFRPSPAYRSYSPSSSSSALPKGSLEVSSMAGDRLNLHPPTVNKHTNQQTTSGQSGFQSDRGDSSVIGEGSVVEGDTGEMLSHSGDVRTKATANRSSSPRRASTMPKSAGPHTPRRGILTSTTHPPQGGSEAGPSTPLLSNSLPSPSSNMRSSSTRRNRSSSEPGLSSVQESPVTPTKGKRKAEDGLDITPPDQKSDRRATFILPEGGRRTQSQSEPSRAPSSYHRKRARLSSVSPNPSPSRSGSSLKPPSGAGTWSSRTSVPPLFLDRVASRATSTHSNNPQGLSTPTTVRTLLHAHSNQDSPRDRRRSVSELSIPISALIAPHAPSVSRSSTYHMRDPHRPPPLRPTSWGLHFKNEDEEGSVAHAWFFFIGFILFPLWWYASFAPIPRTRRVGGTDTEKAVTIDDPQVEHDARSWRFRCRIMAVASFLTYIPFIVLVAIFASR